MKKQERVNKSKDLERELAENKRTTDIISDPARDKPEPKSLVTHNLPPIIPAIPVPNQEALNVRNKIKRALSRQKSIKIIKDGGDLLERIKNSKLNLGLSNELIPRSQGANADIDRGLNTRSIVKRSTNSSEINPSSKRTIASPRNKTSFSESKVISKRITETPSAKANPKKDSFRKIENILDMLVTPIIPKKINFGELHSQFSATHHNQESNYHTETKHQETHVNTETLPFSPNSRSPNQPQTNSSLIKDTTKNLYPIYVSQRPGESPKKEKGASKIENIFSNSKFSTNSTSSLDQPIYSRGIHFVKMTDIQEESSTNRFYNTQDENNSHQVQDVLKQNKLAYRELKSYFGKMREISSDNVMKCAFKEFEKGFLAQRMVRVVEFYGDKSDIQLKKNFNYLKGETWNANTIINKNGKSPNNRMKKKGLFSKDTKLMPYLKMKTDASGDMQSRIKNIKISHFRQQNFRQHKNDHIQEHQSIDGGSNSSLEDDQIDKEISRKNKIHRREIHAAGFLADGVDLIDKDFIFENRESASLVVFPPKKEASNGFCLGLFGGIGAGIQNSLLIYQSSRFSFM